MDEIFTVAAQRAGGIEGLLDEFFKFLHNRTDFYIVVEDAESLKNYKMGFPPNVAEQMVLKSFRKYPYKSYESPTEKNSKTSNKLATPKKSSSSQNNSKTTSSAIQSPPPDSTSANNQVTPLPSVSLPSSSSSIDSKTPQKSSNSSSIENSTPLHFTTTTLATNMNNLSPRKTPAGKQIPIGNGGIGKGYTWTQTLRELTITIDIPANIRSKDIQCHISAKQLSVFILQEMIIFGELEDVINVPESMWTLTRDTSSNTTNLPATPTATSTIGHNNHSNNSHIIITLEKIRETWWKSVLLGEEEIDTNQVDSVKNISDYDLETQQTINKILFEQQEKRKFEITSGINPLSMSPYPLSNNNTVLTNDYEEEL
jgi:hypothetical protein